jgi:hypothetical protein
VKLVSARLSYARKVVTVKLRCPAATVGRCTGRAKLTTKRRSGAGSARTVVLGRAPFSIKAGSRAKIKVKVTRAGRRLLRRVLRLRGRATNAARDGAGRSKTTAAAVTIRPRR